MGLMFFSSSRPRLEMERWLSVRVRLAASRAEAQRSVKRSRPQGDRLGSGSRGSCLLLGRLLHSGNQAHPEMEDGWGRTPKNITTLRFSSTDYSVRNYSVFSVSSV